MPEENGRYFSANRYFQEIFGEKVYKLSLIGGLTCPTRDGSNGTGGCIFCSRNGSGDFAAETIDDAIQRLSGKSTGQKYIAYFQSFTGTYGDISRLTALYTAAAMDERIAAVSIATRPDCLGADVMALLKRLRAVKPLFVELGLQTVHERTAQFIRRGYPLSVFSCAVSALKEIGAEVIVHLILGLPGETKEDMIGSVRFLNRLPVSGVKLQLLHILKGTDLGDMYCKGELCDLPDKEYPFTLSAYAELICQCIGHLRKDIVIHRITGDAPKKDLLSPLWSADKKKVLNTINHALKEKDITQGCLL